MSTEPSGSDSVESAGIASGVANVGTIASTATTVNIGSSTGSTAPTGDWSGAAIPTGALTLTGITLSASTNVWVNLNLGGVGSGLTAFTPGAGVTGAGSKNFALSITNVKSDETTTPANNALVVTSGGTARWVGITNLTAQSATVIGSVAAGADAAAWSALDGNVLDIGNFTAATDAASTLTATAGTGAALLRVGAIDYSAFADDTNALTLTATGSTANQKTATIQLTETTATLGGAQNLGKTTVKLDANGVLAATDLVIDGLVASAAGKGVNFSATDGEIVTTDTFTVHTTDTTGGTLANVTAAGKATFDQVVGGTPGGAAAVVNLGSKFTADGLDVNGGTGATVTTLTLDADGTEMLVGAVTAADGDTPASTTLADVNLKGGVIATGTGTSTNNKITASKVNALGAGNALTAAAGTALAVDADVFSGTATEAGAITVTGASTTGKVTVKSITQGLNAGANGTTLAGDVTVTGLVSTVAMTGTNTATVKVADGQTFNAGFDVKAGGVLDLSGVTNTNAATDGITVGAAAVTTGPEDARTPAVAGNLILADGATLKGSTADIALIKDGTAAADGTGGVSTIVLQGTGNKVEGVIDAGQLSLVAEGQGGAELDTGARLTVGKATQGEGEIFGDGALVVNGDYTLNGGEFTAGTLTVTGKVLGQGGTISTNNFTATDVVNVESGSVREVGNSFTASNGIHVMAGGLLGIKAGTASATANVGAGTSLLVDKEGVVDLTRGGLAVAGGQGAALDGRNAQTLHRGRGRRARTKKTGTRSIGTGSGEDLERAKGIGPS